MHTFLYENKLRNSSFFFEILLFRELYLLGEVFEDSKLAKFEGSESYTGLNLTELPSRKVTNPASSGRSQVQGGLDII